MILVLKLTARSWKVYVYSKQWNVRMLECYKVRMVVAIDGLIWNKKVNETAIEENVFRFLETEYHELSQQDKVFFHIDRIKEKIRKGTNAVTWNKTIYYHDMKSDRKTFSVKREL